MSQETPAGAAAPAEREGAGLGVRRPGPDTSHPTARRILDAAKRILTERGYQAMTLQAISLEAQVNKAGVWYYFGGKQQLVHALLEDLTVNESLHFGAVPPAEATPAERVALLIGSVAEVEERVRRYEAFYQLLPEVSRDEELRGRLGAYYQTWYAWAAEVLEPAAGAASAASPQAALLGQFASVLLDGVFMQLMAGAPGFDLAAALEHARTALLSVLERETAGAPSPAGG